MPMGKILLPVHERPDLGSIADTAFVLARKLDALVEGVFAYTAPADEVHLYYDDTAPAYREIVLKDAEERCQAAQNAASKIFDRLTEPYAGIESRFQTSNLGPSKGTAKRARISDMTVVGKAGSNEIYPWPEIRNAALFQSGRPVVIAPGSPVSENLGKTVIVGWKDCVEAARALQAARPLLARAEQILIISAGEDAASSDELKDVEAYLSLNHGNVSSAVVGAGKPNTGQILLGEVGEHPDALLVMGAYSHWRWTEWIFGGVTDYVLQNTSVPVMMAH